MTEPNTVLPAEQPERKKRHTVPIVIGVLALAAFAAYATAVALVSGDVPTGTTVRGVAIGGMSAEQAAAKLEEELSDTAGEPIRLAANGKEMELDPSKAGLEVDWQATAEQDSGLILNPIRLLAHISGDVSLDPVTTADSDKLEEAISALAEVADTEPVEPRITYTRTAKAVLKAGSSGQSIDVPAAAELVAERYLSDQSAAIELPLNEVKPQVSAEEAEKVLKELAQPAVSSSVTVKVEGEKTVKATPDEIADNLTFAVKDGTLEPSLDGPGLHKALADQLKGVERPGRDATFKIVNDRPVIVKSRAGRAIKDKELVAAVLAVLPETEADKRVAVVKVKKSDADFTTADAKALNITEKLSTFLQKFPPAEYRYINVGEAARRINGTVLKPGDTFSMNDTVKERTRENGYTEGFIISGGRFREELGGGVSIITTAMWTAAFQAGLERIEQHAHGLYISRYQAGLEATVSWGHLDLRFRNDSGNGVLITATRYNDGVRITMWGTKKYDDVTATFTERYNFTGFENIYDDGPNCVPSDGSQGFSIAVTRRLIKDGKSVRTETWPTTYKPTPNVICGPRPSATPKPTSTPKPSASPTSS